jgi:hypothetical protein
MIALRPDRPNLNRLPRRLRRRHDRLGREVKRHAEHVGILDVEQVLFIQVVRLPTERPADDLLAQKLSAERPNAEHVRHGVRIPAFRKHGNRHHTADGAAELIRLTDRVHDLAKQFLVGDALRLSLIAGPLGDVAAKAVDFIGRHVAEVAVERIAGFELFAVDEQRVRPRQRIARSLIEVAKERKSAIL